MYAFRAQTLFLGVVFHKIHGIIPPNSVFHWKRRLFQAARSAPENNFLNVSGFLSGVTAICPYLRYTVRRSVTLPAGTSNRGRLPSALLDVAPHHAQLPEDGIDHGDEEVKGQYSIARVSFPLKRDHKCCQQEQDRSGQRSKTSKSGFIELSSDFGGGREFSSFLY